MLITHAHGDHYSSDDLKRIKGPKTQFVAPADVAKELSGNVKAAKPGERFKKAASGVEVQILNPVNPFANK